MDINNLKDLIQDVPDFPKPGIIFKDISTIFQQPAAVDYAARQIASPFIDESIDVVAGIESRGFLLGPLIAQILNARFVMIRKPGKLPGQILSHEYDLEYGSDKLEIQTSAIAARQRVLIHDDVLATGGTAAAAQKLIENAGGSVVGFSFLMELEFLNGRRQLKAEQVSSVLKY